MKNHSNSRDCRLHAKTEIDLGLDHHTAVAMREVHDGKWDEVQISEDAFGLKPAKVGGVVIQWNTTRPTGKRPHKIQLGTNRRCKLSLREDNDDAEATIFILNDGTPFILIEFLGEV